MVPLQSRWFLLLALTGLSCLLLPGPAPADDTVLETWTVTDRGRHPGALTVEAGPQGSSRIRVDLSGLDADTRIHSARLLIEREPLDGTRDEARVAIEILPEGVPSAGTSRPGPLRLLPPWYDALDATAVVRTWLREATGTGSFLVKTAPGWVPERTALEICFQGEASGAPSPVGGLHVRHRAGQTFITWRETEDPIPGETPSWGTLRRMLATLDDPHRVRYRIYRHSAPITRETIQEAEWLADVPPLSAYNVRGRSVDELIRAVRTRAIDDDGLAKKLARTGYFESYHPDMPEMDTVRIERFAIEDERPLRPGTGLYVHHPSSPGSAFYAVAISVDGVANLRDFPAENSLQTPVAEGVGPGVPVRQGEADVTVFFDFPGTRYRYVQWAAPPLAHLPGQYFNWGVFIPRELESATTRRLSVFFHDSRQRYLKPPWPHRQDTVLVSPHDSPWRSFGYGHHEALGTLRSFGQGRIQPFFARRVDAFLEWAREEFDADPGAVSCGGHGAWGGTAALQYGLRRSGHLAVVLADQAPDPDPAATPAEYRHYGRENEAPRATHLGAMEAVWGRRSWGVPCEGGHPVWDELDLPARVRSHRQQTFPFLSLGAGSMHVTWTQETELMKAYLETRNAFLAEFFWGSSEFLPLPSGPFDPRSDRPLLACRPCSPLFPEFLEKHFRTGKRGYGGGSRLNTIPRWRNEDIVDEPDRFEVTIYGERRVSYGGSTRADTTLRNTRRFRPEAGARIRWQRIELEDEGRKTTGEVAVGEDGLVTVPAVEFGRPARWTLEVVSP